MSNKNIWLIGCGGMAQDYAKVLTALQAPFLVIGRGATSARAFTEKTGHPAVEGGLEAFLHTEPEPPVAAIVAVGVHSLADTSRTLLEHGIARILTEKPGGLTRSEIKGIAELAAAKKAEVAVAYNRRFYASTLAALELIAEDGGMQSMHFEFTEWAHTIRDLETAPGVKEAWFVANSTHVVDLAFYLGGIPAEFHSYTSGSLDWHPDAAVFAGAGRTERGILFSYQANWDAPGRWGVEALTSNYRLIFRPMETLQVMKKGSVQIAPVEIDDRLDKEFKPGLYRQVQRFLAGDTKAHCSLEEQFAVWDVYCRMAGYACP